MPIDAESSFASRVRYGTRELFSPRCCRLSGLLRQPSHSAARLRHSNLTGTGPGTPLFSENRLSSWIDGLRGSMGTELFLAVDPVAAFGQVAGHHHLLTFTDFEDRIALPHHGPAATPGRKIVPRPDRRIREIVITAGHGFVPNAAADPMTPARRFRNRSLPLDGGHRRPAVDRSAENPLDERICIKTTHTLQTHLSRRRDLWPDVPWLGGLQPAGGLLVLRANFSRSGNRGLNSTLGTAVVTWISDSPHGGSVPTTCLESGDQACQRYLLHLSCVEPGNRNNWHRGYRSNGMLVTDRRNSRRKR